MTPWISSIPSDAHETTLSRGIYHTEGTEDGLTARIKAKCSCGAFQMSPEYSAELVERQSIYERDAHRWIVFHQENVSRDLV